MVWWFCDSTRWRVHSFFCLLARFIKNRSIHVSSISGDHKEALIDKYHGVKEQLLPKIRGQWIGQFIIFFKSAGSDLCHPDHQKTRHIGAFEIRKHEIRSSTAAIIDNTSRWCLFGQQKPHQSSQRCCFCAWQLWRPLVPLLGHRCRRFRGGIMAGEGGSATNERNLSELVDFLGPAEIPV